MCVLRNMIFLIKMKKSIMFANNNKKICTHCNKIAHTIETCYKKHDYPSSYKFQYGKSSQINSMVAQEEKSFNQYQIKQDNIDICITRQQYHIFSNVLSTSMARLE